MSPIARPLVAYFTREQDLLAATGAVRSVGIGIQDVFRPHVHGLETASGLRRSPLSQVCFFAGLTGLTTMLFIAAFASIPAFIPVTFEVTVLGAALITVSSLFAVASLWPGRAADALPGVTDDRFALVLDPLSADGPARALCIEHGAVETAWLEPRALAFQALQSLHHHT